MANPLKTLLIILSIGNLFVSINVKSGNSFYPEASIFAQDEDFFIHVVERGQTVYSISKTYNVLIDLIYQLNPGSETTISVGQELKIPQISGSYIFHTILPNETLYSVAKQYYMTGADIIRANPGLSVQTFLIGKTIRIPVNQVTHPIEGDDETRKMEQTNALLRVVPATEKLNAVNVALLLPFEKSATDNGQQRRFIEYYQGFLMAIDSLKRTGKSTINLQLYDLGYSSASLRQALDKPDLQQAHLIIGGFTDEQIKALSDFTERLQIPYVIPFTSRSDEPLSRPNTYQLNTPYSFLYARVASAFCDKYRNGNIIFITDTGSSQSELVQAIESEMKRRNMTAQILAYNSKLASALGTLLHDNTENVIVPTSGTEGLLTKIVAPLLSLKQSKPTRKITVFGHPEWQRYSAEYNNYYTLNATICSIFFVDQNAPAVKTFYNQFRKWFSSNILDSYPKYSMLGFDTGMFFISGLSQFGTALETNINNVPFRGIQTDFRFRRVSNWGGFINTNLYFITFNPDYTVEKRIVAN